MALTAAGAMAVATSAFGQATVSIDELFCSVFDGAGNTFVVSPPAAKVQAVLTDSGNSKITCHAPNTGAPTPTKRAVLFDFDSTGLSCGTSFGITTDWHAVVTSSGRTSLTCHVNVQ